MAEPFKLLLDADVVRRAGRHLQRAWPAFERERFERLAIGGLDARELKARAMHIADALEATLPPRFGDAAEVIEAALGAPLPVDGEPPARDRDDGSRAGSSGRSASAGAPGFHPHQGRRDELQRAAAGALHDRRAARPDHAGPRDRGVYVANPHVWVVEDGKPGQLRGWAERDRIMADAAAGRVSLATLPRF